MNGIFCVQNTKYKSPVTTTPSGSQQAYTGIAEKDWEEQYYNNKKSFKDQL